MSTPRLVFVELDARGAEYVREHLAASNPFCTALLDIVAFEPGKVFTLVPAGTPPERMHRFTEGGLTPADSLRPEQAAYLLSMVREAEGTACIVDDFEPSWTGGDYNDDGHAFGVGDDVYHLLTAESPPESYVSALEWSSSSRWHGVAAIVAQPPELEEDRASTPEALEAAAHSVLALTCTAYDGEGFVVWRRSAPT